MGIFWQRINQDIDKFIKKCKVCIIDKYEFPIKQPKIVALNYPFAINTNRTLGNSKRNKGKI